MSYEKKLSGYPFFIDCYTLLPKKSTAEVNKLDIITAGAWRVSGHIVYTITGGTDVYSTYPDCRKDDYRQFKKDGRAEINEGSSKCNSTDPQSQLIQWKFLNNSGSIIEINGVKFIVDRLDNNNFSIHTQRTDPYAPQNVITYSR